MNLRLCSLCLNCKVCWREDHWHDWFAQYHVYPHKAIVRKVKASVVKETMSPSEAFGFSMSQPRKFEVAIPCTKAVAMVVESLEFMATWCPRVLIVGESSSLKRSVMSSKTC